MLDELLNELQDALLDALQDALLDALWDALLLDALWDTLLLDALWDVLLLDALLDALWDALNGREKRLALALPRRILLALRGVNVSFGAASCGIAPSDNGVSVALISGAGLEASSSFNVGSNSLSASRVRAAQLSTCCDGGSVADRTTKTSPAAATAA